MQPRAYSTETGRLWIIEHRCRFTPDWHELNTRVISQDYLEPLGFTLHWRRWDFSRRDSLIEILRGKLIKYIVPRELKLKIKSKSNVLSSYVFLKKESVLVQGMFLERCKLYTKIIIWLIGVKSVYTGCLSLIFNQFD